MTASTRKPRMSDVAAEAGVALATVSRALNEPHMLRADTLARVHDAIARLGYVPDLTAGSLASSRSFIVGAVVPTLANSWFADTLEGMSQRLAQAGYHLMLAQSGYGPDADDSLVAAFLGRRVDAIALTGAHQSETLRTQLRHAGLPVVQLWDLPDPPIDMAVGFSNADAGVCVARHFMERGRQSVGFIGANEPRSLARLNGLQVAWAAGRQLAPAVELIAPGQPLEAGAAAIERLVARVPQLDAVFCSNDTLAAGALLACRHHGWSVPARLAVAGFSDMPVARACTPALTTVRVEPRLLGEHAARLLLARLQGQALAPAEGRVDLGFELIVRAST